MPYSIPGIQDARAPTFGFSGAITPENPNIYSIGLASSDGTPGGPWLPVGSGRAFNHAPRMRHAAKSSYVQTSPFAVMITAVAPDGTREARPAAATVPSGSHSG